MRQEVGATTFKHIHHHKIRWCFCVSFPLFFGKSFQTASAVTKSISLPYLPACIASIIVAIINCRNSFCSYQIETDRQHEAGCSPLAGWRFFCVCFSSVMSAPSSFCVCFPFSSVCFFFFLAGESFFCVCLSSIVSVPSSVCVRFSSIVSVSFSFFPENDSSVSVCPL